MYHVHMQTPKEIRVQTIITNVVPGTVEDEAKHAGAASDAIIAAITQVRIMQESEQLTYDIGNKAIRLLCEAENIVRQVYIDVVLAAKQGVSA